MKKIIIVVLILIVIVVLGAMIKSSFTSDKEDATAVRLALPQVGSLIEAINAPGEVKPRTKVEISARVSARITALPFEEGDKVAKGDVLIRLDASDLEASLKSVQATRAAQAARIEVAKVAIETQIAQIDGSRASLDQAKRHLVRQKSLLSSKDVSQSVVDEAHQPLRDLQYRCRCCRCCWWRCCVSSDSIAIRDKPPGPVPGGSRSNGGPPAR